MGCWLIYMVTCSTTDVASETIALRDNDMTFIFFVYVAPIPRIRGMTRKESIATSQQLANAIIIPAKKVEKLATKWPSCRNGSSDASLCTQFIKIIQVVSWNHLPSHQLHLVWYSCGWLLRWWCLQWSSQCQRPQSLDSGLISDILAACVLAVSHLSISSRRSL